MNTLNINSTLIHLQSSYDQPISPLPTQSYLCSVYT